MRERDRVLGPKSQNETEAEAQREGPSLAPDRFERRRAGVVAAAIPVLNSHGFKGMRLTTVAELIGLRATGVTYYFPRKEELAVACLESGYAIFNDLLDQAEQGPDAASRIAQLIALCRSRRRACAGARPCRSHPLPRSAPWRANIASGWCRDMSACSVGCGRCWIRRRSAHLDGTDRDDPRAGPA